MIKIKHNKTWWSISAIIMPRKRLDIVFLLRRLLIGRGLGNLLRALWRQSWINIQINNFVIIILRRTLTIKLGHLFMFKRTIFTVFVKLSNAIHHKATDTFFPLQPPLFNCVACKSIKHRSTIIWIVNSNSDVTLSLMLCYCRDVVSR